MNRLANETSPYLLQHADNPVDWYPWGEEAFARARAEGKPILLSVGYSSCHWCHVMAHESFENPETARLMNEWFVNVKVDREERPDVDSVYMTAVQATTGQGGWPMTVFLTPELKPFYAGTYFPPDDGHGRPGFPRLLEALHHSWEHDRGNVTEAAQKITDHLQALARRELDGGIALTEELPDQAVEAFAAAFDQEWGGFGGAPKFPSPGNLLFLLAYAARVTPENQAGQMAASMALNTLHAMATGGMYDQLGGGFARYSVDEKWVVPHFEKMLYDNAQLARCYVQAWQLTKDPFFERIARETLDYLIRDMRHESGGFFSAEDADSEGIEGKFYVWSLGEVERLFGKDAGLPAACYGITGAGNFRDPHHPEFGSRTVLTYRFDPEIVAAKCGLPEQDIEARLAPLRERMLAERSTRVRPGLDDKVLTSWNGLALAAFAEAGRAFGDARYLEAAIANAEFLARSLWRGDRLLHTWKDGRAHIDGMLEDYVYLGLGLVELYKATGDLAHLEWSRALTDIVLERFVDPDRGGFFDTADDAEPLLVRPKDSFDQATPSRNGATALLLLWMARYYGTRELEDIAADVVGGVSGLLLQAPTGFGTMWQVIEGLLTPSREVVITGSRAAREEFEREAGARLLPWVAVAPTEDAVGLPMFEGREAGPAGRGYVCENMVCGLPALTPAELREQLGG